MGGNAYTEAVQKELSLPFDDGRARQEGRAGRRHDVRRREAGAARDERKPAARNSEDLRLLQGDGLFRPHRPHHPERRRVVRSTGSRHRSKSASARRSSSSIPSRRSRSTPQKLGVPHAEQVPATAAVAVGLALRKGGRPMIKINLLTAEKPRAAKKPRLPQFSLKGQQLTVGCALILVATRRLHRLALLHARATTRRRSTSQISAGAARKRSVCTRSSPRSSSSSSAGRSCSSASASSSSFAKTRPDRSTCSTRSAGRCRP